MKRIIVAFLVLCLIASPIFAQDEATGVEVSTKKEVAIFALGCNNSTWWNSVPSEVAGTIDIDIQRVFLDLGRFTVIGMDKRFSTNDVSEFIDILKQTKEDNFVLPEEYQFGEAFLTEADFNKLVGAFIIAVPSITSFETSSSTNSANVTTYRTEIKTNVTFINAAEGTLIGIANVETSGSSKEGYSVSTKSAINGIPSQLQFEIRSIREFQNVTRILSTDEGIRLQLGKDMGIKLGDEYAVISRENFDGFEDEKEVGRLMIKEVGQTTSKATKLYSKITLEKDVELREVPRLGSDFSVYAHLFSFKTSDTFVGKGPVVGLRYEGTRGFYSVRPYATMGILINNEMAMPINTSFGAMYSMYLGRLELGAKAGLRAAIPVLLFILQEQYSRSDDMYFTHLGAEAGAYVSWLLTDNIKIVADAVYSFNYGLFNGFATFANTYSGLQFGIGVTLKE